MPWMQQTGSQRKSPPLHQSLYGETVEQTMSPSPFPIKLITYLIVLWGYSALVSMGVLNPGIAAAVYLLIVLSWFRKPLRLDLSRGSWHLITMLMLVITVGFAYYNIVEGLLYFLIYLIVNKLFQPQRIRDVIQLFTLSFFLLVLASVLSDSINFVIIFMGYIFLVVAGLILLTVERDAQLAKRLADERARKVTARPMRRWRLPATRESGRQARRGIRIFGFVLNVASITAVVVLLSSFLFLSIPRFSIQKFITGLLRLERGRLSGFSDRIDFRSMSKLQTDPTVVMRLQPLTETGEPCRLDSIRVRGTSLDQYTGREWVRGPLAPQFEYVPKEKIMGCEFAGLPFINGSRIRQRVFLQPMPAGYVFGLGYPIGYEFSEPVAILVNQDSDSIQLLERRNSPLLYEAVSLLEPEPRRDPDMPVQDRASTSSLAVSTPASGEHSPPTPGIQSSASGYQRPGQPLSYGPETRARSGESATTRRWIQLLYLQLPPDKSYSRIHEFAREITKTAKTSFECARIIEAYLQTSFTYQMDVQMRDPEHFLEDFLFRERSGNCEYFATAMVYMLRTLGIPSRIVTGFYSSEWNDYGKYFVVRQENAHSWVEVWFDTFGWMTFDPSPQTGVARYVAPMPLIRQLLWFLDSLRFHWYRYVIDYNFRDQRSLTRWVQQRSGPLWAAAGSLLKAVRTLTATLGPPQSREMRLPALFLLIVLVGALGMVLFLLVRDLIRPRAAKAHLARYKGEGQVPFYNIILERLSALGFARRSQQTPREFAHSVVSLRSLYGDLIPVTESYYRVRYNQGTLTLEEEQVVDQLLALLAQPYRGRPSS